MKERHQKEAEKTEENKVFYLVREHYSKPEVLLFVAPNREYALAMLHDRLSLENNETDHSYDNDLRQLNLERKEITVVSPPGDNHLIR